MIIRLADTDITLLPEKGIFIAAHRLLCVADMHFEKDSFYESRATFLPPYGSLETLQKLETLVARLQPKILIAAGDSLHDKNAALRMQPDIRARLNRLVGSVRHWHWLTGNHDNAIPCSITGNRSGEIAQAGIFFRHQAIPTADAEISGHYHPKIRLNLRGHNLTAPCFVQQGQRLILPAFGQYTGGLDIDNPTFHAVVPPEDRHVFAVHDGGIFAV